MFCIGASSRYRPTDINEDELPSNCLQATASPMLLTNQCTSNTYYIDSSKDNGNILPSCSYNTSSMSDYDDVNIKNDKENQTNQNISVKTPPNRTTQEKPVRKDVSKKNWMNSLQNLCG